MMKGSPTPMGQALEATVRICKPCSDLYLAGDRATHHALEGLWEKA